MISHIQNLVAHRELFFALIIRDIKIRYKQSMLGIGWAILQPLLMMIIFTIVFSKFTRIPTNGIPYPIFSYCALLPWTFFSNSLTFAIPSIVNNSNLVTKIYVPKHIFPIVSIFACLFDFFIACLIFWGMMIYFHIPFSINMLYVIVVLIVQIALTIGIALLFSGINVFFRDVRYVIPIGLQLFLFLSPIIYSLDSVPKTYRFFYLLNPMAGIIESYRNILLHGQSLSMNLILPATILSMMIFLGSFILFNRFEGQFADVI